MREVLDLRGGSGATYRFRRWAEDQPHQPIAGNFVVVAEMEGRPEVLVLGETNNLSSAVEAARPAKTASVHIFTRLNVARLTREAEHADLVAAYPAAKAERTRA